MKSPKNRRRRKIFAKKILVIIVVLLVGASGIVLSLLYQPEKIVLRPIPTNIAFNLNPKNEDQKIEEIKKFLDKESIAFEDIERASDSGILIRLEENGQVHLSDVKYAEELTSLQLILKRLTMEGKRFKRLDLRYERPIIVL